jgi:outer membrane protein assembly factor BamB
VGDTVVVGSCNGLIHGIDKATGRGRWKYEARADGGRPEFHSAALVTGGLLILGSDDRRTDGVGFVYAIEAASGAVRWKTRIGRGSMTDVVRSGDRLFLATLDCELVALDLATGRKLWSFQGGKPLGSEDVNFLATPAVTRERVYFGGSDGVLYALSPEAGTLAWKSVIGSRVTTAVVPVADALFLGTLDGRLLRADASRGEVTAELKLGQVPFGPIVPSGKLLLVLSAEREDPVLNAVEASLAAVRWSQRAAGGWSSARPYLWRGKVLAGDEAGRLSAFAPDDGSPVWTRQLDGVIRGVGFEDDRLFVGTLRGAVFAVRIPADSN